MKTSELSMLRGDSNHGLMTCALSPRVQITFLVAVLVLFPSGCQDSLTSADLENRVTLKVEPSSVTLVRGDSVELQATPRDEGGKIVPGYNIRWTSADDAIATVDPDGMVTGRDSGSTNIVATGRKEGEETLTGESDITVESPETANLSVSTSTSGDDQDSDGYTVTVDGSTLKDLGPNGTVTFSGLSKGDHSVELTGVASNCSVDGSNPKTVSVTAGNTASTSFSVSCSATTGSLDVSASTSGDDQDSDGYTVTVDGSSSQDIGPNGTASFSSLSEGDHEVELTGIASNCSVDGSNPKTVSVTAGNTASTSFSVSCSAATGSLDVSASTSGDDQDSDGYTVTVDGSTSQDIGPNGTASFSSLSEGDHEVELTGIASNCSVDGSNPKTVSVTAGNTASTGFSVSCSATTGSLDVSASTSGDDQDSDGYTVTVGGSTSKDIGPNGSATFSGLSEGEHSVELSGIASNCSVDGYNPKTVTVTAGSTVSTSFSVSCSTTAGALDVSTSTSGSDRDTDGYTATVDGSSSKSIGPNGTVTFSGLAEGDHSVELTGVASNCSVDGSNPKTVTVTAGSTVSTSFSVSCSTTAGALDVSTSTSGSDQDTDGYTATVDGSSSKSIGPNGTVTFSGLAEGDHSVELTGVASNCSVDGSNPRTVSVTAGNTASTSFSVSCSATTGSLDVSASTSGDHQDSDGYTVTVNGSTSKDLGPNGTVTFSGLSEGDHSVELTGVASNCSVDGSNPQTVSVTAGNTASTSFSVSCSATTGSLDVSASTSGDDQDSDGYTVTVDSSSSKDIGPNGSTTFSGLSEGEHSVELSGIASNCSVDGSNPKTVTVTTGNTASTSFSVSCSATTGSLDVSASTSGDDQDSDGYTVTVDGSTSKDLGPNGTVTFSGLSEGDHSVELSGVASNCSVDGSNPKTVTVTTGNTASTGFSVSCSATTGSLDVSASTSGDDQDSDGYTVTVGGSTSKDIGPNGSATFSGLSVGDHSVELSGVASNCSVDGSNPKTVSVTAGNTASTSFSVSCSATTGSLDVSASTSGDDQDSDGYTATVDGSSSKSIGPNGTVTFSGLSEGDHSVELSGIASNCSVDGSNPQTVSVTAGNTASTSISVSCSATTGSLDVSASTSGDDQDSDGYTVTVDGSSSQDIGPNGTASFSSLSEGDHEVELTGIASNCSVDGSNPKTVTVTADNTASTSFSVNCESSSFSSRNAVLWEYEEWSVQNTSYSGNPFDIVATVTFDHQGSSKTHTTEMFYDGGDTWNFRFTGTKTGTWTFTTSSDDPELDGLSGTVDVSQNSDSNDRGFLTSEGNRFAIQVGDGEIRGFLLNSYQIDDSGPYKHTHITTFDGTNTSSKMRDYVVHARERGFTSVYIMLNNNLLEMGAYGYDETSSNNPDLTTFQVLDEIITMAHEEGMRVHFWRWGDESRNWTPLGLPGGINGTVDQRVTRYFAARLGPLPGWSMGYGFDLHEWTNTSELKTWFDDFQGWLGWEHFFSARAGDLNRSSGAINGYAQSDTELGDFFTDAFPSYNTLVDDLSADSNNPHLLEERNVLGRWGVDAEDTRRLMWRTAMAGGMGGWYGHFNSDPVFTGDEGYPNPDELKTHRTFWKGRFLLSFERANNLTDGRALASSDNSNYVIYKEGTSSIEVDLTSMDGTQPAVAVNTGEPYNAIDLGTLSPEQQTIELPAEGDWAIAIGEFPE